jgi:hypothetical protein
MERLPLCTEPRTKPAWSESAQERRDLPAQEISTLCMERHETTDEEFELVEMRYQQAMALLNLQDLFAEGQLDFM